MFEKQPCPGLDTPGPTEAVSCNQTSFLTASRISDLVEDIVLKAFSDDHSCHLDPETGYLLIQFNGTKMIIIFKAHETENLS